MPNKENIQKWVDALRSGEYEQTHGSLRVGNHYCCLGVACEIYGRAINNIDWFDNSFLGSDSELPPKVADWLGLKFNPLLLQAGNIEVSCIRANDDLGYDFNTIADLIERTYINVE